MRPVEYTQHFDWPPSEVSKEAGEGRWTIMAAVDEAVPAPVLSTARYERFSSRGEADFADKVLSALRYELGRHQEGAPAPEGGA